MLANHALGRRAGATILTCLGSLVVSSAAARAADHPQVVFDIPDKIECRDVTPEKCAAAHPTLKVIEAKFKISASFVEGGESKIVDFDYMISSPGMRLKILDYLPNTTLESTFADDRIEVADSTESTETNSDDAKVAYTVLSLGGSRAQTSKKSEQNHYKRVAPKALVLASGTINRGHGVFYKLRPSTGASLEGAKEFTFLAIVPKNWRGDWCSFNCAARSEKKSLVSTSVTLAGIESAHVGLYFVGDHDASDLASELCRLQQANNGVLAKQLAKEATKAAEAMHATTPTGHSFMHVDELLSHLTPLGAGLHHADPKLDEARHAIEDVEQRLEKLSDGTGK